MTTTRPVPSCSVVSSSSPPPLFPAHQRLLRRTFSSKHYRHNNGSSSANPYLVLGVPVNSSYETVKSAFLKQAMEHHPDLASSNKNNGDTTIFVRIRQAFEEIVQDHKKGGAATSRDNKAWQNAASTWKNEAEFQEWFRQETSNHLTFDMSHDTRQEVIRVYRTMSNGGRDLRGGYWEMARQLAEREAVIGVADNSSSTTRGGGAAGQLEVAGKTSSSSSSSNLRRRRKR